MKKLDELGISPWPWQTFEDNWIESAGDNPVMSNAAYACNQNDARLIATAPELYEALREAVVEFCHECEDTKIEHCRGKCFVARWREVLAKASGESEVTHE